MQRGVIQTIAHLMFPFCSCMFGWKSECQAQEALSLVPCSTKITFLNYIYVCGYGVLTFLLFHFDHMHCGNGTICKFCSLSKKKEESSLLALGPIAPRTTIFCNCKLYTIFCKSDVQFFVNLTYNFS